MGTGRVSADGVTSADDPKQPQAFPIRQPFRATWSQAKFPDCASSKSLNLTKRGSGPKCFRETGKIDNGMTKPDDEGTMGDGFKPAPVPDNEAERLREVSVLDLTGVNGKDPQLNDIIQIACAVADTPIAMVNILDRPDQHTLQSCGVPQAVPTERPIEGALCQFVLAQGDVLVIEDLRTDERTWEHPFINPPMSLRF